MASFELYIATNIYIYIYTNSYIHPPKKALTCQFQGLVIVSWFIELRFDNSEVDMTHFFGLFSRRSSTVKVGIIPSKSLGCALLDFNKLFHPFQLWSKLKLGKNDALPDTPH